MEHGRLDHLLALPGVEEHLLAQPVRPPVRPAAAVPIGTSATSELLDLPGETVA